MTVTEKHFPTANHKSNLINIHDLLLNLPVITHLRSFFQIGCWLYILWICLRSNNRVGGYSTFHPDSHCLHPNQLPMIQTLKPWREGLIYLNLRSFNTSTRLDFYVKSFAKILDQWLGETIMVAFKGTIYKQKSISLEVLIDRVA